MGKPIPFLHSVFLSQEQRIWSSVPIFKLLQYVPPLYHRFLQFPFAVFFYYTIAKIFLFCFRESKIALHPGANAVNYKQNKRHEEYNIGTFIQVKNMSFGMKNKK